MSGSERLHTTRLAHLIAARVRAIVPAWLTLSIATEADQTFLEIDVRGRRDSSVLVITEGYTAESAARLFASNVLNTVQDVIAIETHLQWSAVSGPGAQMPMHFATIRDGRLVMGYGEESRPALAVAPLPLDEIIDPEPPDASPQPTAKR